MQHIDGVILRIRRVMEIDAYTDNHSSDGKTAQTLLISAVEEGNVNHVKDVLLTYSFRRCDLNLGEALCVSALMGHFEVVQLLMQSHPPANVGYKDETGRRPIHYAAKNGNPDILTILLRHGSVVNSFDSLGITPLLEACKNNNVEATEVLLSAGASVNSYRSDDRKETTLYIVAGLGYADVIRVLLKYAADPAIGTSPDSGGLCPLHEAVIKKHADATRVLSEHRKSVLLKDKKGRCALHFAADSGNLEIVEILVASGASVSSKDYDGWTPLIYAIFAGRLAAIDLLITLGSDINTNIGCDDYTALHFVSMTVYDEIALRLLQAGAFVDARTRGRRDTSLLTAISAKGTKDIIKHLLFYGADPNARDFNGNTPLHKSQAIKSKSILVNCQPN